MISLLRWKAVAVSLLVGALALLSAACATDGSSGGSSTAYPQGQAPGTSRGYYDTPGHVFRAIDRP